MSYSIGKEAPYQQFLSSPASGNGDKNATNSIPSNMEAVETKEEIDPCLDRVDSRRRNG